MNGQRDIAFGDTAKLKLAGIVGYSVECIVLTIYQHNRQPPNSAASIACYLAAKRPGGEHDRLNSGIEGGVIANGGGGHCGIFLIIFSGDVEGVSAVSHGLSKGVCAAIARCCSVSH